MKKDSGKGERPGFSWGRRFSYWFDNRMARGSFGLILALVAVSVLLALLIAGLIVLLGFHQEGPAASVFWDGVATVINAWMPAFEDGSPVYLALMSVIAIAGLLFTSVLIGIITGAIEVKINDLKKGNSLVLERDHIVVLGFYPGEYALLRQLMLAAAGRPACIVVAGDMERDEMEQAIRENIDIPKNVRVVCRTADIADPASIERCAVETCKAVIVSPTDDMQTLKAVLAVSSLLAAKGVGGTGVSAIISRDEYRFPPSLVEANHIATLQTGSVLAKLIAHSCTQTGISDCFREIFNFEGSEFYLADIGGIDGLTFGELMLRLDGAVPVGVCRGGQVALNPPADHPLRGMDAILVFAAEAGSARLGAEIPGPLPDAGAAPAEADETDTVVFGRNGTLPVILRELPANVSRVCLAGPVDDPAERAALERVASERGLRLDIASEEPRTEGALLALVRQVEHVVILNDHALEPDEADMAVIFLLLNLRDVRTRCGLGFNITVELRRERNQALAGGGDHTDFIVSSSMSSLILAQLAENPALIGVFREIMSNAGNEIYIKNAGRLGLTGRFSVRALRWILLRRGNILLGCMDGAFVSRFNPSPDETITLTGADSLIVIGEN